MRGVKTWFLKLGGAEMFAALESYLHMHRA